MKAATTVHAGQTSMSTIGTTVYPETVGEQAATIPVELSARFLEHFSEFMYSPPQKTFEELISNARPRRES